LCLKGGGWADARSRCLTHDYASGFPSQIRPEHVAAPSQPACSPPACAIRKTPAFASDGGSPRDVSSDCRWLAGDRHGAVPCCQGSPGKRDEGPARDAIPLSGPAARVVYVSRDVKGWDRSEDARERAPRLKEGLRRRVRDPWEQTPPPSMRCNAMVERRLEDPRWSKIRPIGYIYVRVFPIT
jgi:hypothetical protein